VGVFSGPVAAIRVASHWFLESRQRREAELLHSGHILCCCDQHGFSRRLTVVRFREVDSSTVLSGMVKLIECPRDAWQGIPEVIPTEYKAEYLRELVSAGFQHIDAVSFVSPKHVKQMADSEDVMTKLNASLPDAASPEIIGIVVNDKGLERALATPGVSTIGYPYSISAYFRRANANMSRDESRALVEKLKKDTAAANRGLVIYISMAFGNPYDEPWGPEIVQETLEWLKDIRVRTVSLADTVGTASPQLVGDLYRQVKDHVAGIELGVHLHSRPENAQEKILAAYEAGCRRFDSALTGLGGCPFAGDHLVGNIATEQVIAALRKARADPGIDPGSLGKVLEMTNEIRAKYAHATLPN
jgi:hydroxymethylglutaryl-CoA lyase